jgi:GntR family transcriptional repressor for pyruvate dehydrogenase complex
MSKRRSLSEDVADALLTDILNGKYPPGSLLPSEMELAEISGTSRLTIREAVKALRAKRVLEVTQGRGTFVIPVSSWSVLDPVLLVARSTFGNDSIELERGFLEARRLVEVAIAKLAAVRRTDEDIELLIADQNIMKKAMTGGDVKGFIEADIAFHQRFLDAAGNPFIAALFDPMSEILHLTRHQLLSQGKVRIRALEKHQAILDAMILGDPLAVEATMTDHMEQIEEDLETYVRDSDGSMLAVAKRLGKGGLGRMRQKDLRFIDESQEI